MINHEKKKNYEENGSYDSFFFLSFIFKTFFFFHLFLEIYFSQADNISNTHANRDKTKQKI